MATTARPTLWRLVPAARPDDPLGTLERADREAGFMSEKLYHVLPVPEDEAKAFGVGPKGVLRAVKAEAGG